jgi:hypothetical protein
VFLCNGFLVVFVLFKNPTNYTIELYSSLIISIFKNGNKGFYESGVRRQELGGRRQEQRENI